MENGADAVVDYTKEKFWEKDEKYDIVYDTATNSGGNEDYKQHALSVLKTKDEDSSGRHGQYVAINGSVSMWLRMFTIGTKTNEHIFLTKVNTQNLDQLTTFAVDGKIKPVVTHRMQFNKESIDNGFGLLQSRRVVGKIVFSMDEAVKEASS